MEGKVYKPYKSDMPHSYAMGPFVCAELLAHRPGTLRAAIVGTEEQPNEGIAALLRHARDAGVPIVTGDKALARLSPKGNTYAIAAFEKWEDELRDDAPHIVLVHPSDAGNVGTILRTALGFGVRDIALIAPCVDLFDPRTVRASMGALFAQRTHTFASFEAYRARYTKHSLFPFALEGALPLQTVRPPELWAIVAGNEAAGLPPEIVSQGQSVYIPQTDLVDSLNLAVAAAIGLWHFSRG